MCLKSIKKYYMCMGCVTLAIMIAIIVGLIVTVVSQFSNNAGFWPITATFLNMLATLVMGSGIANLFYSHALLTIKCDVLKDKCNILKEQCDNKIDK